MVKFVTLNRNFVPLDPYSIYESSYETMLVEHSSSLFPEYFVSRFKKTLPSAGGDVEPDLVFIERNYRSWWLAEVETVDHSLHGHVLPQVSRLVSAECSAEVAEYIVNKNENVDLTRLRRLINSENMRPLVIFNYMKSDWIDHLRKYPIHCIVVELFKDHIDTLAFRKINDFPKVQDQFVSDIEKLRRIPGAVRLKTPSALSVVDGELLNIRCGEFISNWKFLEINKEGWLVPKGKSPLKENINYRLIFDSDNRLSFEVVTA